MVTLKRSKRKIGKGSIFAKYCMPLVCPRGVSGRTRCRGSEGLVKGGCVSITTINTDRIVCHIRGVCGRG